LNLARLGGVAGAKADPADGVVNVPIGSDEQLTSVVGLLAERGFRIAGIGTHLPSLDEVFLAVTGQKASAPQDARDDESNDLEGAAV
jgi:oleandomycin transport system ATP-binding protein